MMPRLSILMAALAFGFVARLPAGEVGLIRINGAIGPATESYILRAIGVAGQHHDACLVVELDTPGGLLISTEQIVQNIYTSSVPIVVYVTPSGARAASAGCFITLAADIAAMAPHTTIGAAHPVEIGGGEVSTNDVMTQKLGNAYGKEIEAIAEKRGRNADWAISAVQKSVSATAEEALDLHVIDLIARDFPDLLRRIDGRIVNGSALQTAGDSVVEIPMTPGEQFFQLLWRPEVMFLLMLAAIYGIIGEFSHPGAVLPGVVGAISLILALYMASILPVNFVGLALIGLAVILFVIDVFAPTHGVLTAGGIVSFFLGALMLFNRAGPAFRLSLAFVIPATLFTAVFFIFVVAAGLRAQYFPNRAGRDTLLGKTVPALVRIDTRGGKVFVEGEYWNALSETPVEAGRPVEIVGLSGLTLKVKPKPVESQT